MSSRHLRSLELVLGKKEVNKRVAESIKLIEARKTKDKSGEGAARLQKIKGVAATTLKTIKKVREEIKETRSKILSKRLTGKTLVLNPKKVPDL